MQDKSSRRAFLATGLALPATALASVDRNPALPDLSRAPLADPPKFSYRTIGKTGLKVTSMGFGCMVTSDPSVIEKAADLGVTYFDTARGYANGNNERMVGAALKAKRKQLVLSTKSAASDKKTAMEHLETSLREIGTDYVDIWYIHAKSKKTDVNDELLEAHAQARKEGKIRFSGVSTHSGHAEIFAAVMERQPHIDVVLTSYNFSMDPALEGMIETAAKAGIGIVGMKVMAGGFRRSKPDDKVAGVLKREGAMLSALKWVLRNPNIHTTIPSITDMDQLEENLRSMSEPFSDQDKSTLAAHLDYIRPLYCRSCGSCAGTCDRGLPVSDLLRILSYADGYGQFPLGRERFSELPQSVRDVRCAECSSCTVSCPNGVRVVQRLTRAQELFA
jgi:uncharacterized protein